MTTTPRLFSVALTKDQIHLMRALVLAYRDVEIHTMVTSKLPLLRRTNLISEKVNVWARLDRLLEWDRNSEIRQFKIFTVIGMVWLAEAFAMADATLNMFGDDIKKLYRAERVGLRKSLETAMKIPFQHQGPLTQDKGKA